MWHLRGPPAPGPAPAEALAAVDWLGGEHLVASWRTRHGWLLLTELRLLFVHPDLGPRSERDGWQSGPTFFLFALGPPTVEHGRFVHLVGTDGSESRYEVDHPEDAAGTIDAARAPGTLAWQRRRDAMAKASERPRPTPAPVVVREVVREVVKVPCRYCGHLVEVGAGVCPTCGAPLAA